MNNIQSHLTFLYGADVTQDLLPRVERMIAEYRARIPARSGELSERDSLLITYGDQIQAQTRPEQSRRDEEPLKTLNTFCEKYLTDVVGGVHILPFYPWTSDDGFSVTDYREVDPNLGTWEDISALQSHFRLMFDGVINHISSQSGWFKGFLHDDLHYSPYFITVEGDPDLSQVVRPRALPLLTKVNTPSGEKKVWTTFSEDQIDLNYKNPEVLLEILDVMLMYAEHGATFIRLDAIAYMWKEIGTTCIHLPQTHHIIQFLRAAFDQAAPHVHFITETNVPHMDNISYFGDGTNEARLVYNFALPPLTLHTFHAGNAQILSTWAKTLTLPSDKTTFFNFLASHDGVGLNPARGILPDADIDSLVEKTLAHGGLISYKTNPDGTQTPYEMNINYFDALSNPHGDESLDVQVDRFLASQAIMLSITGVPGIYFHSLFGSRGWLEGVRQTGRNRTINRQKCQFEELQSQLADEDSLRSKVFSKYTQLLTARRTTSAFDPHSRQNVLDLHPAVFAVERIPPDGSTNVLCLHNVSRQAVSFSTTYQSGVDLFAGRQVYIAQIFLKPYQVLWLRIN